jgi:hypothetical protein
MAGRRPLEWTVEDIRKLSEMAADIQRTFAEIADTMAKERMPSLPVQGLTRMKMLEEIRDWTVDTFPGRFRRLLKAHRKATDLAAQHTHKSRKR